MFETPILLIIFNRPETTSRVFDVIRQQKPRYLYVAADGPRADKPEDVQKCQTARDVIKVDWDCELYTLYRKENRGCGLGPSEAITWFFDQNEQGIIIEDDCLPHSEFFLFCSELLNRYKNNDQIFFIGGTNFQNNNKRGNASYYFSAGNQGTWGWASWKRAWINFDYYISDITEYEFIRITNSYFKNRYQKNYWSEIFKNVKKDRFNESCWDYQFYFSGWINSSFAIIPNKNLVSNIGHGIEATHTLSPRNKLLNRQTFPILPIKYADKIRINKSADVYLHRHFIQPNNYGLKRLTRYIQKLRKLLSDLFEFTFKKQNENY